VAALVSWASGTAMLAKRPGAHHFNLIQNISGFKYLMGRREKFKLN
jgi:hypothetical protein